MTMNTFKRFKPFNPLLAPPPQARGEEGLGGWHGLNLRKRFERSEAIERLERFEREMGEMRDAL